MKDAVEKLIVKKIKEYEEFLNSGLRVKDPEYLTIERNGMITVELWNFWKKLEQIKKRKSGYLHRGDFWNLP